MPRSKEQFREIREKTRNTIMGNALKLFATNGFHGTSISDIAKASGVSKGLAYNYFESKQKLAEAILKQILVIGENFEKEIDSIEDPYESIRHTIEYTLKYIEENEEYWRFYIMFVLQPDVLEMGKEISSEFVKGLLDRFEALFAAVGIKNPRVEAMIFGALFDGIGLDYFIDKKNFPLNEIKERLIEKYSKENLEKLR